MDGKATGTAHVEKMLKLVCTCSCGMTYTIIKCYVGQQHPQFPVGKTRLARPRLPIINTYSIYCMYLWTGNALLDEGSDRLNIVRLESLFDPVAHSLSTAVHPGMGERRGGEGERKIDTGKLGELSRESIRDSVENFAEKTVRNWTLCPQILMEKGFVDCCAKFLPSNVTDTHDAPVIHFLESHWTLNTISITVSASS